jgi:hypothetical protein
MNTESLLKIGGCILIQKIPNLYHDFSKRANLQTQQVHFDSMKIHANQISALKLHQSNALWQTSYIPERRI